MNKTYPGLYISSPSTISAEDKAKPKYPVGWSPTVYNPVTGLGLLYCSPFEDKIRETFTHDGIEMEFVDYWPTKKDGKPFNYVRAAYTEQVGMGIYNFNLVLVHLSQIDLVALKKMEVWNLLSDDEKQKLETSNFTAPKIEPKDEEVTGTTGTKGRKRDPAFANLPRELKCACGKVQPQHASITDAQAKKANKSFEDYVATWQCMVCRPAGAKRVRFGKAPNPDPVISSIPKTTICIGCNKPVTLVPQNIIEKAALLKITVEELVKNYKCRSCGGRITKAQKEGRVEIKPVTIAPVTDTNDAAQLEAQMNAVKEKMKRLAAMKGTV